MKKLLVLMLSLVLLGCTQSKSNDIEQLSDLMLTSPAFQNLEGIPYRYTCNGINVNPRLVINNVPENTQSLAIIIEDPDAPSGVFTHWLIWNILIRAEIEEDSVPAGAVQGLNDFGENRYSGPCPPARHRYYFKLYALDSILDIDSNSERTEFLNAIKGHITGQTQIIAYYG